MLVAFAEHVIGAYRGRAGRRRGRARPRIAAPAARRLRLAGRARLGRRRCSRPSRAESRQALEFEKVAVCLARGGDFSPSGTAGWEPDDPGLDFGFDGRRPGSAARAGVRDRGVLPDRRTPSRRLSSAIGSTYASERGGAGPRAWSTPLAARAADRARWLAQRVHLGRRPVRLDAAVPRAAAGAPDLREPGDDGAARSASTSRLSTRGTASWPPCTTTAVGLLERLDVDSVLTRDHAERVLARRHAARVSRARRPETERLRTAVKLGLLEERGPAFVGRGEGVAGRVWETDSTIAIDDYGAWNGRAEGFAESDFHATVAVPLRAGGEVVGVIGLAYQSPGGRSVPRRWRSSSASPSWPRSRSRTRGSTAALQQSEELHRRSSTARPT